MSSTRRLRWALDWSSMNRILVTGSTGNVGRYVVDQLAEEGAAFHDHFDTRPVTWCVDDDHADSRSSRMTNAAGVFNVTRFRLWIRVSISSRVGRAARRSSSARRSDIDCPEPAALTFSLRCSASGEFRIWTILDM